MGVREVEEEVRTRLAFPVITGPLLQSHLDLVPVYIRHRI